MAVFSIRGAELSRCASSAVIYYITHYGTNQLTPSNSRNVSVNRQIKCVQTTRLLMV